jgi:hypothetical protein
MNADHEPDATASPQIDDVKQTRAPFSAQATSF